MSGTSPDGSSHNVYMYGGVQRTGDGDQDYSALGEIWILSLPSFHWVRSGTGIRNTRAGHSCAKIHEKYLVIYRGNPQIFGTPTCDSSGGLQLVDMNSLQWTTKLEVKEGEEAGYRVPEAVFKEIGGK